MRGCQAVKEREVPREGRDGFCEGEAMACLEEEEKEEIKNGWDIEKGD